MENQLHNTNPSRKPKSTKRVFALVVIALCAGLLVAILASRNHDKNSSSAAHKVAVVRITSHGFEPATLAVKQGTKVIWSNSDDALHQVAANPYPKDTDLPGLKSEILNNAQAFTYIATTVGNFGYHDQLHPTINGTLVVEKQ